MSGPRFQHSDQGKFAKHSVISDTESSDDSDKDSLSWIDSFLDQPGSDWFCRIPETYINDGFNVYGLGLNAPHEKLAFKQILGKVSESSDSFDSDSEDEIEKCAENLYGQIHARYIYTDEGMSEMIQKFKEGVFGICPRYSCNGHHLLPIGLTDKPGVSTVKLYCCHCKQLYHPDPEHAVIDGAFFTRSFPPYLLLELSTKDKKGVHQTEPSMFTSESQSAARVFVK
ncbi:Casein kinase II regulatory subunit family protein [Trichomonas vaginalis G3]|uniref:Casein kinase II subunit beta n=1 Tax=Trichomonas vaginalis (strain ATCC PRA-98 / G3) TaxID=412133 RepID=A2FQS1_TRIV3|nr:protein kinase regulator protein [Trichomonas vaginalis G3]EAX92742.1 Casein kinase II regulatory subunit family protein [Trichomonas vaginalis G3]KAI5515569.1 protein kinase regulator protein [Trichomonas vaginalis G3]|eukprot:XP_001305672.1 Casein kinase II regulatory subunit family protein [Trichomonas vaginalis G3]